MGKDDSRFDPLGNATRAQAAAALHRYVELVIDRQTAQGLDVNDSTYAFNGYGEAAMPADNKKYLLHTVRKNEYFWIISRRYGCTIQEVMDLNSLKMSDVIHPGDVLMVPVK